MDPDAGYEDGKEARGLEIVLRVDRVGDGLIPGDGFGRPHPAFGEAAIFVGGEGLHGAGQPREEQCDGGGNQQAPVPGHEIDPDPDPRDRSEDGHLVMAAQKGDAKEHAGERSVGGGPRAA